MPTPRTYYAQRYPVVSFLDTAMEAKIETSRLRRKAGRIQGQIAEFAEQGYDEICREAIDVLSQELIWVLADIQRCEDQISAVKKMVDKLPFEMERVMLRIYYLEGLHGSQMSLKVHDEYGAYYSEDHIEKKFVKALELLQSIFEMEVLCV